jgi:hypothetical protein
MKKLICLFCCLFAKIATSQIKITEVNFDVPRSEKLNLTNTAHIGEFIELYNYTDKDIDLTGWRLNDMVGAYIFPQGTVIKSANYLVIAYHNNPSVIPTPSIPSIYPSSIGHEPKIIYQNKIILRNDREHLQLVTNRIGSTVLKHDYIIDQIKYRTKTSIPGYFEHPYYNIYNNYQNSSSINYSLFHSLQLNENDSYTAKSPMPFHLDFTIPTQDFFDSIEHILIDNYNGMTHADQVNYILNLTCDKTIANIEQTPTLTLTTQKRCAVYDTSGNVTHWTTCTSIVNPPPTGYTEEQIQQIDATITVFPNPTTGAVTTQWDTQNLGKIKQLHASSSAGVIFYTSGSLLTTTSAPVNLGSGSMGLYIITFVLDTDQIISRNVIKY